MCACQVAPRFSRLVGREKMRKAHALFCSLRSSPFLALPNHPSAGASLFIPRVAELNFLFYRSPPDPRLSDAKRWGSMKPFLLPKKKKILSPSLPSVHHSVPSDITRQLRHEPCRLFVDHCDYPSLNHATERVETLANSSSTTKRSFVGKVLQCKCMSMARW